MNENSKSHWLYTVRCECCGIKAVRLIDRHDEPAGHNTYSDFSAHIESLGPEWHDCEACNQITLQSPIGYQKEHLGEKHEKFIGFRIP